MQTLVRVSLSKVVSYLFQHGRPQVHTHRLAVSPFEVASYLFPTLVPGIFPVGLYAVSTLRVASYP
jgi:hypothetical protein